MQHRAIIDIGTNTAHLLIAVHTDQGDIEVLHKRRRYTFLGAEGLDIISEAAQARLWEALDAFKTDIDLHQDLKVRVIATEGLRSAANGRGIYDHISQQYGWPMSIISGDEEARLIYEGVALSIDLSQGHALIMDIGGGSVEFILVSEGHKILQRSYPIGISRLHAYFHQEEPLQEKSISAMSSYLDDLIKEVIQACKSSESPIKLVGCAGTFEVLLSDEDRANPKKALAVTPIQTLNHLLSMTIYKEESARALVPGIPKERSKYIVVALLLIKYICDHLDNEQIYISKYALKEGAITDNAYF